MLTPERILFIVFTVPPILLLIVIFFTRPAVRHLLDAFVGGLAFAILHISWDMVAHAAGWRRYPFTTEAHAPPMWYTGSVFWGGNLGVDRLENTEASELRRGLGMEIAGGVSLWEATIGMRRDP